MDIKRSAVAGTLESSDCMVTVRPCSTGNQISLQSDVAAMFGDTILSTIQQILSEMQVSNAEVSVVDHGALDCVIRARLQCALCRGAEEKYDWSKEVTRLG